MHQALVLQELGWHGSCLKADKICLESPQMKCNEKPQEAERQCIEGNPGCFVLKSTEQQAINSSSCCITKPLDNDIYIDLGFVLFIQ